MKNIWKNHKFASLIAVFLALVFLIGYFLISPLIMGIKNKNDEIQKKMLDNIVDERKMKRISEMEDDYVYYQNNEKALQVVLEPEAEVSFIEKLEGLAGETGNAIAIKVLDKKDKEIKQLPKDKETNTKDKDIEESLKNKDYLSFQLTLEGDYESLLRFIHKLENSTNYINILSLTVNKEEKESDKSSSSRKDNPSLSDIFASSKKPISDSVVNDEKEKEEVIISTLNIITYLKK